MLNRLPKDEPSEPLPENMANVIHAFDWRPGDGKYHLSLTEAEMWKDGRTHNMILEVSALSRPEDVLNAVKRMVTMMMERRFPKGADDAAVDDTQGE